MITNCYNTGTVTGNSDTHGIAGKVGSTSKGITNCYYLAGAETGDTGRGAGKTEAQFASGEVAWLLQSGQNAQVWGQAIGPDDSPVLTDSIAKKVLKVTFATQSNPSYAVEYGNPGGMVALPADPAGAEAGYAFAGWRVGGGDGAVFTGEVSGTTDLTVVAVQQELYGGETGEDSITMIFGSEPVERNLDAYMAYIWGGSEPAKGNFTYAFASGGNTAGAIITYNTLVIPANAALGDHTLKIIATEWTPQVMPVGLDYGSEPVTLTLSVHVSLPGEGTETKPWLIESPDALRALANYVTWQNTCAGQYFRLTRDVDLGGADNPWTRAISGFAGVFDGGGHRIDGLYIGGTGGMDYESGLFSSNSGAIQNLIVAGEVTSGGMEGSGGIVSSNSGALINIHSEVNITVSYAETIGGVVGRNSGRVENCSYSGTLSGGNRNVGGIVGENSGYNSNATVVNCYNTGSVSGGTNAFDVGGIVGYNSSGTVLNCHNAGSVNGATYSSYYYTGGIVGESYNGTVSNCYNAGVVTGSGTVGNIVGRNYNGAIENCYYEYSGGQHPGIGDGDGDVSGVSESQSSSGEVAWALQNPDKVNPDYTHQDGMAWGQVIGTDPTPVLTADSAKRVVKVTFSTTENGNYAVAYGNPGGKVELPLIVNDTDGNYARIWRMDDGSAFDGTVPETEDITVTAAEWQKMYGGESDPDALVTTYGVALKKDLDGYMGYADGSAAAGSFTYSITDDGGLTAAGIDGSILTIPAGAAANEAGYTLVITAAEREPQIMPLSIEDFGIQDVTLTLKVVIRKADQDAPTDITVTKTVNSITVTAPTGERYEFSLDGSSWQAAGRFDGLGSGTEHTVYVRIKEDENHKRSDHAAKTVTTANADGSATVLPGERLETENGSITNNGSSVTLEDGQGGTTTVSPAPQNGAEVLPNGGVNVPAGSTVTPPGGPDITVNDGATVDGDGNVTLPGGGSAGINGNTVTVPEGGGTIRPDGGGSVSLPAGSTVTDSQGNQSTVPAQGGVIGGDGTYTENTPPGGSEGPSGGGSAGGGSAGGGSAGGGGAGGGGAGGGSGGGGSDGDGDTGSDSPGGGSAGDAEQPADTRVPASEIYTDVVKDSWYEAGVTFVTEMGLFQGVGDGLFAPELNMTRAMFMTVLARLDGQDTGSGDTWYVKGLDWAVANGISDGTREQMVAMLYHYARAAKAEGDLTAFVDADKVSAWAADTMTWAVGQGILFGKDGRRLDPQGPATRAEVAAIFQRFVELENKGGPQ